MEQTGIKVTEPSHIGPLRDETVFIGSVFGYCADHGLPTAKDVSKLPFITTAPKSTPNIRRIRLLSIDIDNLRQSEQIIERFHVGISYLDTQSLQKWLDDQHCPEITKANDPIVSRYFIVSGNDSITSEKRPYLFGEPRNLSFQEFRNELEHMVSSVSNHVLLCHGSDREISVLQRLNIHLGSLCIIDTVKAAQYPLQLSYRYSLQGLLDELKIPFAHLHNAGNDAYFVLHVFLMLAVADAERESDSLPGWVPVVRAVAQSSWALMKDGKLIEPKRRVSKWQPRETGNDKMGLQSTP